MDNIRVPFCSLTGNLLPYAVWYDPIDWQPNFEFYDNVVLLGIKQGKMQCQSLDNETCYQMFLEDFHQVLLHNIIDYGVVLAEWTFVKRGENYGIKLA